MSIGMLTNAAQMIPTAAIGGAAPAATGGLLSGIIGGLGALTGPVGAAASLLGTIGGSGMFGGGKMDSSSATSGAPFYAGDFNVGGEKSTMWLMIGVVILLVILLAKGK